MEYIDLETGYAVLGQADYKEHKRVKMLCQEKGKSIVYAGDPEKVREIQARHWTFETPTGWQDFAYKRIEYYPTTLQKPKPTVHQTAKESLVSAARELGKVAGYEVRYVLILRK